MSTSILVSTAAVLAASVCFVVGLHLMRTPVAARRGNLISADGMVVVVAVVLLTTAIAGTTTWLGWAVLGAGSFLGAGFGIWRARTVPMTDMPQLVSVFNAVGGGAACAIALADVAGRPSASAFGLDVSVPLALDILIGSITFSGSLIAAGKLQGIIPGRPLLWRGARVVSASVAALAVVCAVLLVVGAMPPWPVLGLLTSSLVFGILMVLPVGGADAPVVVSLLNAFTGLAVAMAGFVVGAQIMIIAGALVGAAGTILTLQMAAAMNRSVIKIIVGGFGTGDEHPGTPAAGVGASLRILDADDVAVQLAYARHVIVVPGYGLAASQAQRELNELAEVLRTHDIDVKFAIHPVAGRMPGHMNVLLAEANIPYTQFLQLDEANAAFSTCDVALVIGANDVVNPAARRPGTVVSGMPILDVDRAASIVVLKRSMNAGYAGIDNDLFHDPKTGMYFADAKKGIADLTAAVKTYTTA
ncbi:NAD(P) transhydrogenase subunit beta [Leifsonia xyli subsp. xyli]|nr:NAD(P)(+) transhydrogenase (Re/Si-specific) subunit beta [Leifsonia xyli]ODA90100.1 NAD(P) transhydrogenase subunit beta [Leifsonia xyli subsp. xyli]